jgi:membrane protein EpsK
MSALQANQRTPSTCDGLPEAVVGDGVSLQIGDDCVATDTEVATAAPALPADTEHFRPRGRLVGNLATNIASFMVSTLLAMFLTPYLLRHLGVAAYGLIPLATTAVTYLQVLTTATTGAVGRYLTIAVERNDVEEANRVFTSALYSSVATMLLLLPLALWASWHADWFFVVPPGYKEPFSILLLCTFGMFVLTRIGGVFGASAFSRNRIDLGNSISIVGQMARVATIVLLFTLMAPAVTHVGVGMLVVGISSLIGSVLVWRHLMPGLRIAPRHFSWQTMRQMSGTSGWMVVSQVGAMLYLGIDLIIVNRMIGPVAAGQYGAILIWSTMLRSVSATITSVFAPTVIALYARGDIQAVARYVRQVVKMLGLLIALPIGLVCGFSEPLLRLWLGEEFVPLAPLMSLLTVHLCVNAGVGPLFSVNHATNRVRVPGIVTCVGGVLNLGLAILLAGPVGWGMYGVAAAGAIMLTAKNALFTPIYAAHVLGVPPMTFMRETWGPNAALLALVGVSWLMARTLPIHGLAALVGVCCAIAAVYALVVYRLALTADERNILLRVIRRTA